MTPQISVVVPTYELRDTIRHTLACLDAQTLGGDGFECIFVDDASTDGTADVIAAWRSRMRVTLRRNPQNRGRSRTRNTGWRMAKGNVVVFLDGDMLPHPRLLERYVERFSAGDVDVIGGRRWYLDVAALRRRSLDDLDSLLAGGARAVPKCDAETFFETLRAGCRLGGTPRAAEAQLELQLDHVCTAYPRSLTRALALITANCAVRKQLLEAVDGFHDFLAAGEDTDLGIRLAQRGARFAYAASAEAVHLFGEHNSWSEAAPTSQALLIRHPYVVVVLWHLWAGRCEDATVRPPIDSLAHVAALEGDRTFHLEMPDLLQVGFLRLAPGLWTTERALINHYQRTYRMPASRTAAYLAQAIDEGVLHARDGKELRFEQSLLENWLNERTDFRQCCYVRTLARRHRTPMQSRVRAARPVVMTWTGTYEVTAPASALPADASPVVANLSLPITTTSQPSVDIVEWFPPDLAEHRQGDMIVGYPVRPGDVDVVRLGYRFTCEVREVCSSLASPPAEDAGSDHPSAWLQWRYPQRIRAAVARLLDLVDLGGEPDVRARAHAIYRWMLDNLRYRNFLGPEYIAAVAGVGTCIQLTSLFIALCRLTGIPAREKSGARLTFLDEDGSAWVSDCATPFAHTWAEYFDPLGGWTPVEMHPIGHGRRELTPFNFPDAGLRAEFAADTDVYDEYCFGNLDPYRIQGSPYALLVPTLAAWMDESWQPFGGGLDVVHRLTATSAEMR